MLLHIAWWAWIPIWCIPYIAGALQVLIAYELWLRKKPWR
ncbi:hypothetical protein LCGC14_0878350 [marine sediment metagenome]|uniref:Uncharacterized protein n=1 Tax=marine sediment metagenome TaxID=412755 RepID=A0A0F9P2M0_9ZZZZ